MKLTFRDLKQQKFELDAEPTDLVSAVKEKLHQEKGWEVSLQKLIYSGKILQDDKTVESYNIQGGYIVCMVSKPKAPAATAAPKEPATPAPVASTSTPAPPAAPSHVASQSAPAVPATPTPVGPGASALGSSGSTMGAERAEAVANLESMGFERPQIELAMRAAFYNADRAVEYLLNGIPDNLRQQPAQAAAPAAAATPAAAAAGGEEPASGDLFQQAAAAARSGSGGRAAGGAGAGAAAAAALFGGANPPAGAGEGLGNLDFLRNNTQFQQLRQVVQQQPQMLEPILQQVAAGNPQLAAIISAHPEQFLALLGENVDDDDALPPGAVSIPVTEEERDAIERLCRLGFDRDQATQAYFACDKNEELAANFLFDQPEDNDDAAN